MIYIPFQIPQINIEISFRNIVQFLDLQPTNAYLPLVTSPKLKMIGV
jgi:hypothetical protein